jgi:hypothetical protein
LIAWDAIKKTISGFSLNHVRGSVREGDTMKKLRIIASLLIGFFGLTVQIHATPQEASHEIKQKVSKTAKKAATQANVHYVGSPKFSPIGATSITYAINTSEPVIKIRDTFYLLFNYFNPVIQERQNVWLVSGSAQGPWVPAQSLPEEVPEIVCSQINEHSSEPYQLCALPRSR